MSRTIYELTQFSALAVILLLTLGFYVLGQREKKNQDVVLGEGAEGAEGISGVAGE